MQSSVINHINGSAGDPILVDPEDILAFIGLLEEADSGEVSHFQLLKDGVDLC